VFGYFIYVMFVVVIRLKPALPLEGKLAPNKRLDAAEPLLEGQIVGPESIAVRKDEIYTGVIGGDVIRYKDGKMEVVAKFGKECGNITIRDLYIYLFVKG
jgi:signal peptidase I